MVQMVVDLQQVAEVEIKVIASVTDAQKRMLVVVVVAVGMKLLAVVMLVVVVVDELLVKKMTSLETLMEKSVVPMLEEVVVEVVMIP